MIAKVIIEIEIDDSYFRNKEQESLFKESNRDAQVYFIKDLAVKELREFSELDYSRMKVIFVDSKIGTRIITMYNSIVQHGTIIEEYGNDEYLVRFDSSEEGRITYVL